MMIDPEPPEELPCIGLHPDTDPCPYCGASAEDPCAWGEPHAVNHSLAAPIPVSFRTPGERSLIIRAAASEGERAAKAGEPLDACPYTDEEIVLAWRMGWQGL